MNPLTMASEREPIRRTVNTLAQTTPRAARMLGKRIGVKYAEGFITEKKIGIRSLDALVLVET